MWNIILDLAEGYTWAEQERKEGLLKNWARSMYWARGTNSRTFVVYLLEESGIGWRDMPGPHIGNDAPTQNPPNEPDLTTIYQFDCELIGDGSPGAPRPRRPQK
jgi:hypothetical protein